LKRRLIFYSWLLPTRFMVPGGVCSIAIPYNSPTTVDIGTLAAALFIAAIQNGMKLTAGWP
jgi:hypothetical protein